MKSSFIKSLVFLSSFFILILLTPQCKKDKNEQIPYVYVNFYLNPNSTQYSALNNIGGYMYVTGGVRGIIVYRRSNDEFVALERNCPYQPSTNCAVEVDNSGLTSTDACCGSQFLLMDGSIVKGPATTQMKLYQTSYDGTNLHVFN
jgi:nitrite reductase/ring-hydroxylating ferredoxin subunit